MYIFIWSTKYTCLFFFLFLIEFCQGYMLNLHQYFYLELLCCHISVKNPLMIGFFCYWYSFLIYIYRKINIIMASNSLYWLIGWSIFVIWEYYKYIIQTFFGGKRDCINSYENVHIVRKNDMAYSTGQQCHFFLTNLELETIKLQSFSTIYIRVVHSAVSTELLRSWRVNRLPLSIITCFFTQATTSLMASRHAWTSDSSASTHRHTIEQDIQQRIGCCRRDHEPPGHSSPPRILNKWGINIDFWVASNWTNPNVSRIGKRLSS
jgi:hypothetical protein